MISFIEEIFPDDFKRCFVGQCPICHHILILVELDIGFALECFNGCSSEDIFGHLSVEFIETTYEKIERLKKKNECS